MSPILASFAFPRGIETERKELGCSSSVSFSTLFIPLSFGALFLQTRPIVPRGTEILNWKRPRAAATFIIPRLMIKIKSPGRVRGRKSLRWKKERNEKKIRARTDRSSILGPSESVEQISSVLLTFHIFFPFHRFFDSNVSRRCNSLRYRKNSTTRIIRLIKY